MNNGVHPLAPVSPVLLLPRASASFWFFEQPLRNLRRLRQICKSRPSFFMYEEPNSHGRRYSLTFCSFSITGFFSDKWHSWKANTRASLQKRALLVIDTDNGSRCDFSCFHVQGAWHLPRRPDSRPDCCVSRLPSHCGVQGLVCDWGLSRESWGWVLSGGCVFRLRVL